jgi:hypothetical protein
MARAAIPSAGYLRFHCPGCGCSHVVKTDGDHAWSWKGGLDKPTLRPSVLFNGDHSNPTVPRCHSYVTDGRIKFLADCDHDLAGQEVDLPEIGAPRR